MTRYLIKTLNNWKTSPDRKPLILYGARQVGKTWLLKEFGKNFYKQLVYLNFDDKPELSDYFQKDLDPKRIINALAQNFGININTDDTLIIFDEIQECQRAKDSLKYFNENAPQYHIACAGSFLGVASGKFPVGQVNSFTLYPMSFYEFLEALGKENLVETIKQKDYALIETLSYLYADLLKTYYYVGGMPDAVNAFIQTNDLGKVRQVQNDIINNYKNDFSKHISPHDIPKVRMLWDSIPNHLAQEKKKFVYKEIKIGGRASAFENAMDWLINTGLVYKVPRTLTPKLPLIRDQMREGFKLFMIDTGLLCAKTKVDLSAFYEAEPKIFDDFHGALTEQYVCQEIKTNYENLLFYWGRERGAAEVDFIMQYKNEIIPIEVKAQRNKQAKSLKVYMEEYKPKTVVRTTLRNIGTAKLGKGGVLHSIPLYMIGSLAEILG